MEQSIEERMEVDLREMVEEIPPKYLPRFNELIALTDQFCDNHLNIEYKELFRIMACCLCRKGSPVIKGKPESWAAGIAYAVGRVNFLTDPSQIPHMKSKEIAEKFGISLATMQAKARIIRDGMDLTPLDPDWTLPSRMDDNPLVWMLSMDGFIIDMRMAPLELQIEAYEKGLIPYIPDPLPDDDDDDDDHDDDHHDHDAMPVTRSINQTESEPLLKFVPAPPPGADS